MDSDELNDYLTLRDAYLNDSLFQFTCNDDDVREQNVVEYLTLKDKFDQTANICN